MQRVARVRLQQLVLVFTADVGTVSLTPLVRFVVNLPYNSLYSIHIYNESTTNRKPVQFEHGTSFSAVSHVIYSV